MKEVWKDIKGYEGLYQVSDLGNVKSLGRNNSNICRKTRILKFSYNGDGYAQVTLSNNKNRTVFRVHRLVAETFIPNPNKYETVNHKDENRKNNVVTNLEWLTNADNIRYSQAKKVNQYDLEGNFIREWNCIMDIERSLNIANNLIVSCCKGKYGHKTAGGYIWKYKDTN